ncbi:hypothetical protein JHW43_009252, partial [Diplocarpon mali]
SRDIPRRSSISSPPTQESAAVASPDGAAQRVIVACRSERGPWRRGAALSARRRALGGGDASPTWWSSARRGRLAPEFVETVALRGHRVRGLACALGPHRIMSLQLSPVWKHGSTGRRGDAERATLVPAIGRETSLSSDSFSTVRLEEENLAASAPSSPPDDLFPRQPCDPAFPWRHLRLAPSCEIRIPDLCVPAAPRTPPRGRWSGGGIVTRRFDRNRDVDASLDQQGRRSLLRAGHRDTRTALAETLPPHFPLDIVPPKHAQVGWASEVTWAKHPQLASPLGHWPCDDQLGLPDLSVARQRRADDLLPRTTTIAPATGLPADTIPLASACRTCTGPSLADLLVPSLRGPPSSEPGWCYQKYIHASTGSGTGSAQGTAAIFKSFAKPRKFGSPARTRPSLGSAGGQKRSTKTEKRGSGEGMDETGLDRCQGGDSCIYAFTHSRTRSCPRGWTRDEAVRNLLLAHLASQAGRDGLRGGGTSDSSRRLSLLWVHDPGIMEGPTFHLWLPYQDILVQG